MKLDHIVSAVIRLFVTYLFIWVVYQTLLLAVNWAAGGQIAAGGMNYIIGVVITLAVLFLIWHKSAALALKISPPDAGTINSVTVNPTDLQALGFRLMGTWIAIDGFLQIIQFVLQASVTTVPHAGLVFAIYFAKFLMGVVLIVGARKFSALSVR